jgi:hypothetical protein
MFPSSRQKIKITVFYPFLNAPLSEFYSVNNEVLYHLENKMLHVEMRRYRTVSFRKHKLQSYTLLLQKDCVHLFRNDFTQKVIEEDEGPEFFFE